MFGKLAVTAFTFVFTLLAKEPLQRVEVATTDHASLGAAGTVRITGSLGDLNIEGWDGPDVQVTATRSRYADPGEKARIQKALEAITVTVKAADNGDVSISSTLPHRNFWLRKVDGKTAATVEYRILVPRGANLAIGHDAGALVVFGVAGNIDAKVRHGDIVLQLPQPGEYAIDAQSKLGSVESDFAGSYRGHLKLSDGFASQGKAGHTVKLRIGRGSIKIQREANLQHL